MELREDPTENGARQHTEGKKCCQARDHHSRGRVAGGGGGRWPKFQIRLVDCESEKCRWETLRIIGNESVKKETNPTRRGGQTPNMRPKKTQGRKEAS